MVDADEVVNFYVKSLALQQVHAFLWLKFVFVIGNYGRHSLSTRFVQLEWP